MRMFGLILAGWLSGPDCRGRYEGSEGSCLIDIRPNGDSYFDYIDVKYCWHDERSSCLQHGSAQHSVRPCGVAFAAPSNTLTLVEKGEHRLPYLAGGRYIAEAAKGAGDRWHQKSSRRGVREAC